MIARLQQSFRFAGLCGALARDWFLTRAAAARLARMQSELPTILEFLTLCFRDLLAPFAERLIHRVRELVGLIASLGRLPAPLVWEQEVLKTALRDRLAHLLPRTPTDELVLLTPLQRAGLRQITRRAIEESRSMSFYEPLAVAGLLAMGSLRDPGARSAANSALLQHSRGHVCAAAEEYLACL